MKPLRDTTLTFRLTTTMKEAALRAAEAEQRPLSQLVVVALQKYLEDLGELEPIKPKRRAARRR